jgi:NTE family protein
MASRRINLALQGGGAHGAFTWGVLDRLLEDDKIDIGWISGTSAGAVNAAAVASGLSSGGKAEARATLQRVWDAVRDAGNSELVKLNPFLYGLTRASGMSQVGTLFSPYDFNPLGFDPFRRLLEATIDFERLRADTSATVELLIAATDVGTGRPRLFRRKELTVEAILASACLPQIHHAVHIEGRAYWDGGFSANPDVVTLASDSPVGDTLIVQLNPLDRATSPRTARDIVTQVSTITFNAPLLRDVEMIVAAKAEFSRRGLLQRVFLPAPGRLARIARHRFHVIDAGRHTSSLAAGSKGNPERAMLEQLFRAGRSEATRWLERHRSDIGRRDSIDLNAHYLARERVRITPQPIEEPETEAQPGNKI